jgi:hypothetical protein
MWEVVMTQQLGQLQRLDPRDVWQMEAHQFTPWLVENIGLLSQALGIEIELAEREVGVGAFSVDIFGKEVGTGREVIIENQLAQTDHSHLGQLLTYAAGLDAKIVVWLSPQFRDEHRQALDWLNLHTIEGTFFFAVQLELLKIDDSLPAPNFRLVAQPSEWQKQIVTSTSKEPSEKKLRYREFFGDLLVRLKAASPGFTNASRVAYDSWFGFAGGRQGVYFQVEFMKKPNRLVVHLNISTGDRATNKYAFDQLIGDRTQIEAELGEPLEWQRLDDKKECRIAVQTPGEILSPEDSLSGLKDWAVQHLIDFRRVFGTRIKALDLSDIPAEETHDHSEVDGAGEL